MNDADKHIVAESRNERCRREYHNEYVCDGGYPQPDKKERGNVPRNKGNEAEQEEYPKVCNASKAYEKHCQKAVFQPAELVPTAYAKPQRDRICGKTGNIYGAAPLYGKRQNAACHERRDAHTDVHPAEIFVVALHKAEEVGYKRGDEQKHQRRRRDEQYFFKFIVHFLSFCTDNAPSVRTNDAVRLFCITACFLKIISRIGNICQVVKIKAAATAKLQPRRLFAI